MAEGVCSSRRVRVALIALVVVCVVVVIVAVAVYFSTRDSDSADSSGEGGETPNGPSPIYRLPASLRPLHYDLELFPDIYRGHPSNFSLAGHVVIRVLCQEVTSVVVLHALGLQLSPDPAAGMRVTSGESNNDTLPVAEVEEWKMDASNETLSIHLDRPLNATYRYLIHLSFRAPLTKRFQAAYYSSYKEQGNTKYLAATIFVPTYARMAFPCFDEPAMKAEFTLSLVRKPDFVALSNMPVASSRIRRGSGEEEDMVVDTFQTSPAMSTYLLTFTVCQFLSREANTTRGYTFKAWTRPDSVQQTSYALDVGVKVMPFFDDYFGVSFPLPEQEMIALPEFQYGGMEHWGLVGYKERLLLYSDDLPSAEDRQHIATIIAHELGHMWFGDLLTMVWWEDTWLNEGFATYVEYLGVDFVFPQWSMLDQFLTLAFRSAMQLDAFEMSRPLYKPVLQTPDILAAYDRIIYSKGASVIRMVKSFLGENTFKRGIQRYVQKFQYGSATHEDLWNTLHQEAEGDQLQVNVSDVMRSWTVQNNFPVVMVSRKQRGQVVVTQRRFLLKGTSSDEDSHRWDIPFTFATNATHQPDDDVSPSDVIWVSRHNKEITISDPSIPGPEEEDAWLLGNLGCYGFYRVNYEDSNWRALIAQLNSNHTKIGLANRVQILMDSWSLAKAGQVNYTLALSTLGYLQKETRHVAWSAALAELQDMKALLSADLDVYQQFSIFMQRQTASIFENFDPNAALLEDLDSRTPMLVAQAACSYELPACVELAKDMFAQWRTHPHNNTMTVDMRATFYCTGVAHGTANDWDFMFQRFLQETTASEQARLRLALTCSRDPAILNTLINRTLDSNYIREQDALGTLIACSGNRYGRDPVWAFVRDNLPVIRQKFGTTAFNMKTLFSGITQSFHTDQHLLQLETLAQKYPDVAGAMSDAMETTRANRKWIQDNMATVHQWLIQQNDLAG